jgi:glucosamine 6-phosphate synthetase-like amidotransferase/phosphosugar isomerase protein
MSAAHGPGDDDEKAVMLREIALQPAFVHGSIDAVIERTRVALRAHAGRPVGMGIVTGCGDSYFAGEAARAYLMHVTQRWFEPVEALELSRYLVTALPPHSVVFGVSNSGTVARTIEAVRLARERNAWTFAVTVSAENQLAQTAETLVQLQTVPNIKTRSDGTKLVTPGTITYTASLLGLCAGAVALGESLGVLDAERVAGERAMLHRVAEWMSEAETLVAEAARRLAPTFARERATVIVGGGPNLATAHYAAAKWYEALQWPVHAAQMEEWAHQQYFFTGADVDTIVILPPGGSYERGLEQLRAARAMRSRTIAIAAVADPQIADAADVVLRMPDDIPEALTPFVYKLPFEYLAAHIATLRGANFFGFDDPNRQAVNFRQIFDSKQTPAAR